jgi:hypothetical protein
VTNRPGDPRFYRLLDEIGNLHARKSQDYSPASDPLKNFKASADVGVRPYLGVLTRLGDKAGRIATFARSGQLQNESARDSHIDSAVYHLIAVLLLEDEAGARSVPVKSDWPCSRCGGVLWSPSRSVGSICEKCVLDRPPVEVIDPEPTPYHVCEPHKDFGDGSGVCVTCGCTLFPTTLTVAGSDEPAGVYVEPLDEPFPLPAYGPGSPAATTTTGGTVRVYVGEDGDPDRQWAPV